MKYSELSSKADGEPSAEIRERVERARKIQLKRFLGLKIHSNSQMNGRILRKFCPVDTQGGTLLEQAVTRLRLSARAYDRILKVARTIADLEGTESIESRHLAEAIHYRSLDRSFGRA